MKRIGILGHTLFAHPVGRLFLVGLMVINLMIAGDILHGISVLLLVLSYEGLMLSRRGNA